MTLLDDLKALIAKYDAAPAPVDAAPVDPVPVDPAPVDPIPAPPVVLSSKPEIDAALAAAKGGEVIYFTGDYPAGLTFKGRIYVSPVMLVGVGARVDFVDMIGCGNLSVADVVGYPTTFPLVDPYRAIFRTRLGSTNCHFINCLAMGHATGRDYYSWTQAEWLARAVYGFDLNSPDCTATDCKAIGTNFAFQLKGDGAMARRCLALGFGTDAFRLNGDRSGHEGCISADSMNINASHDDGAQGFEDGPDMILSSMFIRDYRLVDWLYDRVRPFGPGISQGIGMFDGMFDDCEVKRVLILTDHYHGCTFAGARRLTLDGVHCMTQNNTYPGYPQIKVGPAKSTRGGYPSTDLTIRNCIAPKAVLGDDPATRTESGNSFGGPRDDALYAQTLAEVRAIAAAA